MAVRSCSALCKSFSTPMSFEFFYRQIQLEEDERRMDREQTILGKFMYKCGTLKSPRTKGDFEKLLANVQKWKATEVGTGIWLLGRNPQNILFFRLRRCAFRTFTKATMHPNPLR